MSGFGHTFSWRFVLAWLWVLGTVSPLYAQRDAQVPDPDPEIERKSFQVADGFEVNLFAADPLLAKPIQMNFDPAGRLWVACSEVYPQIKPGQKANDKIIILEDTKGTGKADKITVFADGLLIPTGVEPGDGGVYVANSTDLLHLSDTDGDGKADRRARHPLRLRHRGHAPHPAHAPLGAGRDALLQPIDLYSQPHRNAARRPPAERRRHLAVPARDDAAGGLRCAASATPGAITSTAGASRSSPTAPTARASTTSCRAPTTSAAVRRRAHPARPQSRQPQALRPGDPQRPAPARRLAGQPDHQRLPRPSRLPLRASREDGAGYASQREAGADQDEPPRLSADRRQDGAGRRDLHRRLVQPDHPARRGRFPRPAPRPHARPHLARHRQGPAAGRRGRKLVEAHDRGPARSAQGARGLDAAAGQARRSRSAARPRSLPVLAAWVERARPQRRGPRASPARSALDLPVARRRRAGVCWRRCCRRKDHHARAAAVRVLAALARAGWPTRWSCWRPRVADDHPQVRLEAVRALAGMHSREPWSWRLQLSTGRWTSFSTTPCG